MPDSKNTGLINPRLTARTEKSGRSFDIVRRPVQRQDRRGIDSVALPVLDPRQKIQHNSSEAIQTVRTKTQRKSFTDHDIRPALPRQSRSHVLKRPTVQAKKSKRISRRTNQRAISIVLVSMAVIVFMSGAVVSYIGWKTNRKAAAQVEVLSSTSSTQESDVPSEDEVPQDALTNYRVAPDMPRKIKIPRLNIDARVMRLGVRANGVLASPANVYDAGWYDGSSKPGENGAVLVDGHVHGPTKPGVFYRLNSLKQGDTVEIERGDGESFTYQVALMESVNQDEVDMAKALAPIEPGKPGLNIITCSGGYDIKTNKYEKRLIVYLVQQ